MGIRLFEIRGMFMKLREIETNEVDRLYSLVAALSEHHNQVSVNFKGIYPSRPYEETLKAFGENLENGKSRIAVVETDDRIAGFCKVDINGKKGKLDYLAVLPEYRGNGYGTMLMDWAMAQFRENFVKQVEVKVVDGNDAIHLYEKYGFKMNAHLLWYTEED